MRSPTWWLRRTVASLVAFLVALVPAAAAFDLAPTWWALGAGIVVYGLAFAVVFTFVADGPRQLAALVHRPGSTEAGRSVPAPR